MTTLQHKYEHVFKFGNKYSYLSIQNDKVEIQILNVNLVYYQTVRRRQQIQVSCPYKKN